ncbi:hypothetical protein D1BOALGB6SA_4099 [Olavius sp. associated proteobacterium Delta 1]|nr:hypothetical protein D1BOALGB6SA_4099 [Olavius sp. associated proteobacterium Delta 1]
MTDIGFRCQEKITEIKYLNSEVGIIRLWISKLGFRVERIKGKDHKFKSEPQNIEYRTTEFRRKVSLCSVFFCKIDRMHSFDIRHSVFDIRFFYMRF